MQIHELDEETCLVYILQHLIELHLSFTYIYICVCVSSVDMSLALNLCCLGYYDCLDVFVQKKKNTTSSTKVVLFYFRFEYV